MPGDRQRLSRNRASAPAHARPRSAGTRRASASKPGGAPVTGAAAARGTGRLACCFRTNTARGRSDGDQLERSSVLVPNRGLQRAVVRRGVTAQAIRRRPPVHRVADTSPPRLRTRRWEARGQPRPLGLRWARSAAQEAPRAGRDGPSCRSGRQRRSTPASNARMRGGRSRVSRTNASAAATDRQSATSMAKRGGRAEAVGKSRQQHEPRVGRLVEHALAHQPRRRSEREHGHREGGQAVEGEGGDAPATRGGSSRRSVPSPEAAAWQWRAACRPGSRTDGRDRAESQRLPQTVGTNATANATRLRPTAIARAQARTSRLA